MRKKSTFPPPFQSIYYIARFVRWCKTKTAEEKVVVDVESKLKYLMLLKKLITIKQQKEFESTDENNLEDLRRDMKLEIQRVIDSMSNKEKEN